MRLHASREQERGRETQGGASAGVGSQDQRERQEAHTRSPARVAMKHHRIPKTRKHRKFKVLKGLDSDDDEPPAPVIGDAR